MKLFYSWDVLKLRFFEEIEMAILKEPGTTGPRPVTTKTGNPSLNFFEPLATTANALVPSGAALQEADEPFVAPSRALSARENKQTNLSAKLLGIPLEERPKFVNNLAPLPPEALLAFNRKVASSARHGVIAPEMRNTAVMEATKAAMQATPTAPMPASAPQLGLNIGQAQVQAPTPSPQHNTLQVIQTSFAAAQPRPAAPNAQPQPKGLFDSVFSDLGVIAAGVGAAAQELHAANRPATALARPTTTLAVSAPAAAPNAVAKPAPGAAAPPNSPTPPKSPTGVAGGPEHPKPKADAKPENQKEKGVKLVSVRNETGGSTHLVLDQHGATLGETHEALPATPKTAAPRDTKNFNSRSLTPTPRLASSQTPGSSARHQLKGMDLSVAKAGQAPEQNRISVAGAAPLAHRGSTQNRKMVSFPTPGMHL